MEMDETKKTEIWYIGYLKPRFAGQRASLWLRGRNEGENFRIHCEGGQSYCLLSTLDVVDSFCIDQGNYDEYEEIYRYYIENYRKPIKTEVTLSDGWLSPKGDFYPCKATEHDETEDEIKTYFKFEHKLTSLGWLQIAYSHGYILPIGYYNHITKAQKEFLYSFLLLVKQDETLDNKYKNKYILPILERWLED